MARTEYEEQHLELYCMFGKIYQNKGLRDYFL